MAEFLLDGGSTFEDHAALRLAVSEGIQAGGVKVKLTSVSARTIKQNRMLFATLEDIARHVNWHGRKIGKKGWKIMLTAILNKQDVVPGIDGGFVALGSETSGMSRRLFADLITLAIAFGNEHGVQWRNPDWESQVREYLKENGLA